MEFSNFANISISLIYTFVAKGTYSRRVIVESLMFSCKQCLRGGFANYCFCIYMISNVWYRVLMMLLSDKNEQIRKFI